jgi:hypothetical protein
LFLNQLIMDPPQEPLHTRHQLRHTRPQLLLLTAQELQLEQEDQYRVLHTRLPLRQLEPPTPHPPFQPQLTLVPPLNLTAPLEQLLTEQHLTRLLATPLRTPLLEQHLTRLLATPLLTPLLEQHLTRLLATPLRTPLPPLNRTQLLLIPPIQPLTNHQADHS